MIETYRKVSNRWIVTYFVLRFLAILVLMLSAQDGPGDRVGPVVVGVLWVLGLGALLRGCWAQAVGKGYPGSLGLLGLLGLVGLIVLAVSKDRNPEVNPWTSEPAA
jgi:hypothetical protein